MISFKRIGLSVLVVYTLFCLLTACLQRKLLFFPSHEESGLLAKSYQLEEWKLNKEVIGYARNIIDTKRVWLFLHGNAGQAVHRGYALGCFNTNDSVYIMEYPGYGLRTGSPSMGEFNRAAESAYKAIVGLHPHAEFCVLGESIGSGPACHLATIANPPNRIVLIVPFDNLKSVAQEKMYFLPVGLMMRDTWDNIVSLTGYKGRLDIYGALSDAIIPVKHARNLAASVKGSHYHEIPCGHNEWSDAQHVDLSQ